jgi:hypothetical protein
MTSAFASNRLSATSLPPAVATLSRPPRTLSAMPTRGPEPPSTLTASAYVNFRGTRSRYYFAGSHPIAGATYFAIVSRMRAL